MKWMNVIVVFDKDIKNVLMCKRAKDPYKGLYNLVGGKIEDDNSLEEAYRELLEETAISKNDISIEHFMDFTYIKWDMELEVYYGVLKHDVELVEEVNKLEWISLEENFFDMTKFAGDGNIGHIITEIMFDMEKENGC